MDLPVFVRGEFTGFYKAMFAAQAEREDYRVVFTEYFWDMSWCDPCAADPLSPDELRSAGVFWLDAEPGAVESRPVQARSRARPPAGASPVMLTRLHVRYTPQTFPEDLVFQETQDRTNFQARYVLRHPWAGDVDACPEAKLYFEGVRRRQEHEAQTPGCA